jgi:hypothetical protein
VLFNFRGTQKPKSKSKEESTVVAALTGKPKTTKKLKQHDWMLSPVAKQEMNGESVLDSITADDLTISQKVQERFSTPSEISLDIIVRDQAKRPEIEYQIHLIRQKNLTR